MLKLTRDKCSRLLEQAVKRIQPARMSNDAGIPSYVITDFMEYGDFRSVPEQYIIEKLLAYLERERERYASEMLRDFSNDELLKEIKERLVSG